jgi:hypothetical protein
VGFSLIDGGKIAWVGGAGVRELGKQEPVDADTLFIAASNTKALTTLLLAELVDEKKLRWDEPVVEVYPKFKLGDAATTKSVLVKHLICAAPACRARTWNGCSSSSRRRPNTRCNCSAPCSPRATSARCSSTRT